MNKLEKLHLSASGGNDEYEHDMELASKSAQITKDITIEFFQWCDSRFYRADRNLGFDRRVEAQYPEYNLYKIIDEKGNTKHFEHGKYSIFLTIEQVFEEFLKTKNG